MIIKKLNNKDFGTILNASDYIIHDGDVLQIVNELKAAGAEAISINNQRILSNSELICVGPVVQINKEKTGVPFEIKAIGLSEMLYGGITQLGGIKDILDGYGLKVEISKSEKIEIPKYSSAINFKIAQYSE